MKTARTLILIKNKIYINFFFIKRLTLHSQIPFESVSYFDLYSSSDKARLYPLDFFILLTFPWNLSNIYVSLLLFNCVASILERDLYHFSLELDLH
jgi:hypothetical protein